MNKTPAENSRRAFLTGSGAALGGLAFASPAVAAQDEPLPLNAMGPTPQQMQAFLALPDEGPVVMVNLLKFKPDGGEAQYAKYADAVAPLLEKVGAKVLFAGKAEVCLIGNAEWDMIALVEYPRKRALFQMASSPEYQAIHHHREAGLEGQVNYAVSQKGFGGEG